jgi:hypothetical protein
MTEIMLRDAGAAHGLRHVILRYFNVAGADPLGRTGQSTRGGDPSHQGRGRGRARTAREGRRVRHRLSDAGRYLRPRLYSRVRSRGRAFRRARLPARRRRLDHAQLRLRPRLLRARRDRDREADLRHGFHGRIAGRRAGDPSQIVAACERARSTLGWQPQFDDLATIVSHALAWERTLARRVVGSRDFFSPTAMAHATLSQSWRRPSVYARSSRLSLRGLVLLAARFRPSAAGIRRSKVVHFCRSCWRLSILNGAGEGPARDLRSSGHRLGVRPSDAGVCKTLPPNFLAAIHIAQVD